MRIFFGDRTRYTCARPGKNVRPQCPILPPLVQVGACRRCALFPLRVFLNTTLVITKTLHFNVNSSRDLVHRTNVLVYNVIPAYILMCRNEEYAWRETWTYSIETVRHPLSFFSSSILAYSHSFMQVMLLNVISHSCTCSTLRTIRIVPVIQMNPDVYVQ